MSRDRHELEQDRADLLAALTEADGPMRTQHVIATARGIPIASVHRHWSTGLADLRALERAGLAYPTYSPAGKLFTTWALGVDPAQAEREDADDVRRLMAEWEPTS